MDGEGIEVREVVREYRAPRDYRWVTHLLTLVVLFYQGPLVYYVATAFIAPDIKILAYGFTAVVISFVIAIHYCAGRGYISFTQRTRYMVGGLIFTTLVMMGVFTLEVTRINIWLNGGPLAAKIGGEIADAVQPAMRMLEQQIHLPDPRIAPAEAKVERFRQVTIKLESGINLERWGQARPDIEQTLAKEGIPFKFSGKPGEKGTFAGYMSILAQKKAELVQAEKELRQIEETVRVTRAKEETELEQARTQLLEMRDLKLGPNTHEAFYGRARSSISIVQRMLQRHNLDSKLVLPNSKSLIIIGIENILSLSTVTGLILILLAALTSLSPILFTLFFNAHLQRRWEHDRQGYNELEERWFDERPNDEDDSPIEPELVKESSPSPSRAEVIDLEPELASDSQGQRDETRIG